MAKRGYKLQEFVAHSANVNCLNIGKKACRLFLTGGEDHKVNLWAIGKPNSLMSLCGHTSPVESVAFDSAETLVLAGASSGVIKLWDLEEAKVVRGLTGHRSNCTAVEFHPFGEFFASGAMDTNLKLWDIRKKGCIHTYKGHTRGISTIRFTPDGRWVVSGGFDNVVKVWDLTAGKLLHDFKFHENHIRSIDFHPLEFLLATGSADRTVKFWDLETFELIGSTRPEASGVRAISFHPDGRTLFCGLDDSLKVYSWEPVRCHDAIDMGWSTLGDVCIHEGKVLGCSYYQTSVGVWVADILLIEPYGPNLVPQQKDNGHNEFDRKGRRSLGKVVTDVRSTSLRCPSPDYEPKEIKNIYVDTAAGNPVSSQRVASNSPKVILPLHPQDTDCSTIKRHSSARTSPEKSIGQGFLKSFSVSDIAGQDTPERKESSLHRRESITFSRTKPGMLLKPAHRRRPSSTKLDSEVVSAEAKTNADVKVSLDSQADFSLPKPVHARRLSATKFDAEVLSIPSENRTIEDAKVGLDSPADHMMLKPAHARRLSRTNFEAEVLSLPIETKTVNSTKSILDSLADTKFNRGLDPQGAPKELSVEDDPHMKNTSEKLEKMSPPTSKTMKCESQNSGEGTAPIKIVNGVAVVPGRTRTLVERFERREKLNGAEVQTSLEPCPERETPVDDKANIVIVEKKETINNNTENRMGVVAPPTPPLEDQLPSTGGAGVARIELTKDKTPANSYKANVVIPNIVLAQDKMPLDSLEKEVLLASTEDEKTNVPPRAVPRDRTPATLTSSSERKGRLDNKEDEKTVTPSRAVPRDKTTTAVTGTFGKMERLDNKEDEKATTPPRALPRDRTSTMSSGGFERRERFNGKEDQPTRISARLFPPRDKTPAVSVSGIQRRERLNSSENQTVNATARDTPSMDRIRTSTIPAERLERRERFNTSVDQEASIPLRTISVMDKMAATLRGEPQIYGREVDSSNDDDVADILMESHEVFLSTLRSRLTKLQVIRHFFERNDMKGAINAMRKLPDHSVQADVISILMEKMETLNLDLFSCLLPVLVGLLDSKFERHTSLSLEMLLKLVAVFGHVVFSTISAPPTVGVDLHAEQRRECCNQCFAQLQKIQKILPLLVRRGGVIARCAQELNLVLQQS